MSTLQPPPGGNLGASSSPSPAPRPLLRSPFDIEARRALVGTPHADPPSPGAGTPIRDVVGVSFYTDAEKSVADPRLKQENLVALRPLRTFVSQIEALADGWMTSKPPNPVWAALALETLSSWAVAGALLGQVNQQGEYEREWTLGGLALAYLKVRDAPGLDETKRQTVEAWLNRIAHVVQPYYERPQLRSNANNHAYWTGMAVAAAGIASDDRALFDWGIVRGRIGIAQVGPDGILPLERDRRTLALHYHVFALAPLVMLAEMATVNGIALHAEGNGAIRRLADRVIAGLTDPIAFAALGGVSQGIEQNLKQDIALPPTKSDLAWAEPYFARFGDQRLAAWIDAARPLSDARLGGDMTAAFGAPTSRTGVRPTDDKL